jgi:hypothetical protein
MEWRLATARLCLIGFQLQHSKFLNGTIVVKTPPLNFAFHFLTQQLVSVNLSCDQNNNSLNCRQSEGTNLEESVLRVLFHWRVVAVGFFDVLFDAKIPTVAKDCDPKKGRILVISCLKCSESFPLPNHRGHSEVIAQQED